jgi:hypothetical protein
MDKGVNQSNQKGRTRLILNLGAVSAKTRTYPLFSLPAHPNKKGHPKGRPVQQNETMKKAGKA